MQLRGLPLALACPGIIFIRFTAIIGDSEAETLLGVFALDFGEERPVVGFDSHRDANKPIDKSVSVRIVGTDFVLFAAFEIRSRLVKPFSRGGIIRRIESSKASVRDGGGGFVSWAMVVLVWYVYGTGVTFSIIEFSFKIFQKVGTRATVFCPRSVPVRCTAVSSFLDSRPTMVQNLLATIDRSILYQIPTPLTWTTTTISNRTMTTRHGESFYLTLMRSRRVIPIFCPMTKRPQCKRVLARINSFHNNSQSHQ